MCSAEFFNSTMTASSDTIETGDAVYFSAEAAHSYGRISDEECTALILTMPEPLRGHQTGGRISALNGLPRSEPKRSGIGQS